MVDLFESPDVVAKIQAEFKAKTSGQVYKPYIPDGPPPLPKD
jgi:aminobenzoyl-glutamate utilization protein B